MKTNNSPTQEVMVVYNAYITPEIADAIRLLQGTDFNDLNCGIQDIKNRIQEVMSWIIEQSPSHEDHSIDNLEKYEIIENLHFVITIIECFKISPEIFKTKT
jgi:peptidyl-tRNA hydrolase